MTNSELEKKESVELIKVRSMIFFMTVHVIFTVLLFMAMTHVQIQLRNHIGLQERENKELREMLRNHEYTKTENQAGIMRDNLEMQERSRFQYKPKVRILQAYK